MFISSGDKCTCVKLLLPLNSKLECTSNYYCNISISRPEKTDIYLSYCFLLFISIYIQKTSLFFKCFILCWQLFSRLCFLTLQYKKKKTEDKVIGKILSILLHEKKKRKCLFFLKIHYFTHCNLLKNVNNNNSKYFYRYPEILLIYMLQRVGCS